MRKRNGRTARSGAIRFSLEKGNVKSLSRFQCSGLANSKAVDVIFDPTPQAKGKKVAALVTKIRGKANTQPKKTFTTNRIKSEFRRGENAIRNTVVNNYYRPDLQKAVLAKWTMVYQANRRAMGVKKTVPTSKGRTSKK